MVFNLWIAAFVHMSSIRWDSRFAPPSDNEAHSSPQKRTTCFESIDEGCGQRVDCCSGTGNT